LFGQILSMALSSAASSVVLSSDISISPTSFAQCVHSHRTADTSLNRNNLVTGKLTSLEPCSPTPLRAWRHRPTVFALFFALGTQAAWLTLHL
jgi:hypothetical protein